MVFPPTYLDLTVLIYCILSFFPRAQYANKMLMNVNNLLGQILVVKTEQHAEITKVLMLAVVLLVGMVSFVQKRHTIVLPSPLLNYVVMGFASIKEAVGEASSVYVMK